MGKAMSERRKKWQEIVRNFTKETTFHGVKYIAEDTRFLSRRIAWVIVVVSVIIIFTYAIANRLVHYYKYPSNIEVEVGYLDRVPFPTVTMCNQNPYRLAALQEYGVYDIMTHTYNNLDHSIPQTQDHSTNTSEQCHEIYMFNPLVCAIPRDTQFVKSFVETTSTVCQRLCSDELEGEKCSGFLYNAMDRTCKLTSFTGEDVEWFTQTEATEKQTECLNKRKYFYRKQRCLDNARIFCNFEEESTDSTSTQSRCRFKSASDSQAKTWQRVRASFPDVTYNSSEWEESVIQFYTILTSYNHNYKAAGHFLLFRNTSASGSNVAQMETTNFINTTGRCIFLFVSFFKPNKTLGGDGIFRVLLKKESQVITEEAIINGTEIYNGPLEFNQNWLRVYHRFPDGMHKVILEAEQAEDVNSFMLDDIEISTCQDMSRECIQSSVGLEYIGTKAVTKSGQKCLAWQDGLEFFHVTDIDILMKVVFPDESIATLGNQCRFLNYNDSSFPSCLISGPDGSPRLEHCDIDKCPCEEGEEFTCGDGVCIPMSKTCDNERNCEDWTDEGQICDSKISISCTFDDKYICGYRQLNNAEQLTWARSEFNLDYKASLQLSAGPSTVTGETAIIGSQPQLFSTNQRLTVKMRTLQYPDQNGISFWLQGSYGFSSVPVMQQGASINTAYSNDVLKCNETGDETTECRFCIPGGPGVTHRLVIGGVFGVEDDFYIQDIQLSNENCTLTIMDLNTVFPSASLSEDFNSGDLQFVHIPDSVFMQWIFVSRTTIQKTASLLGDNELSTQDCDLCLSYEGDRYNYVYFESSGTIQTAGYPFRYSNFKESAWRIEMLESERIKLTFLDFSVEYAQNCIYDVLEVYDPANQNNQRYCGHSNPDPYVSSGNTLIIRFKSDYSVTDRGVSMEYEIISDRAQDFALALQYNGTFSEQEYISRLITPNIKTKGDHCLTFDYININGVKVYLFLPNGHHVLVFDDPNIHASDWRKAYVTLEVESPDSHLMLTGTKSTDSKLQYILILDNMNIQHSKCEDIQITGVTSVSCDFEDLNQCGYTERNATSSQWVRHQFENDNDKDDKYGLHFVKKTDTVYSMLVSPTWDIIPEGCLQLQVECHSCGEGNVCLDVIFFNDNNGESEVQLKCISARYATVIEVDIVPSSNRFGLIAASFTTGLVLSNVELLTSQCTDPADIRPKQETTTVVPNTYVTDDNNLMTSSQISTTVPTDDEITVGEEIVTVDAIRIHTNQQRMHVTSFYLDNEKAYDLLLSSQDVDLEMFTKNVSLVKDNFVLSCSWNGLPCDEDFTTEVMTDLGYCVTFNSKYMETNSQLYSERPGSEYGLRLTLNTEDYEHVEGIGTNSGIKIHFASPAEIPTMNNMGYAVSPGTHALFSLKYTSSTFLEPDYGTCGKKDLKHYGSENYTTSHCVTECSIESLQEKCGCLVPHMPRFNNSELCSMSEYLQCVIQQEYSSMDTCDCPDACNQTSYDVQLSHSALSGLALHSILGDKEEKAKSDFQNTMDLQHRVNFDTFFDSISKIKGVLNAITRFKYFIGRQTEEMLWFFENGIQFVTKMTHEDIDSTLSQINDHHDIYTTYIKADRDTMVTLFEKLDQSLQRFATSFRLGHPCSLYSHKSSENVSVQVRQDFEALHSTLNAYFILYNTNVTDRTRCTFPHLAIFPDYSCPRFQWIDGKNIPQKAVIDEDMFSKCKKFVEEQVQFPYSTYLNFTILFESAMASYNTYSGYDSAYACEMAQQASQVTTENVTTTASSGSGSGSGGSGGGSTGTTFAFTPYINTSTTTTPIWSTVVGPEGSGGSGDMDTVDNSSGSGDMESSDNSGSSGDMDNVENSGSSGDMDNVENSGSSGDMDSSHTTVPYTVPYTGQTSIPFPVNTSIPYTTYTNHNQNTTYTPLSNTASSGTTGSASGDNFYTLSAMLDGMSLLYKDMLATVTVCLTDYDNFLVKSLENIKTIKKKSETLETDRFDVADLDKIEKRVNLIYNQYIANDISKLEMANLLLTEGSSYTSLSNLNDLIAAYSNRFEQETISSTRSQLKQIEESLRSNYDTMVHDFLALAEYMGYDISGDQIKDLNLFRKPLPSEEDSDLVSFLHTATQVKRLVGNRPISFLENEGRQMAKAAIEDYFKGLTADLDTLHIDFVEVKGTLTSAVADLMEALQTHKTELALGPPFVRENVMQVDVYFGEIKYFKTEQTIGYSIGDFFSDLGGYLGLLLGASVVTVCEILDLIVYNIAKFHLEKKEKKKKAEKPRLPSASKWKEPNKVDVFPLNTSIKLKTEK